MKQTRSRRLALDPSFPYQLGDQLLAIWLPRGRGRDSRAPGLLAKYHICDNPECGCTEAQLTAYVVNDRLEGAKVQKGKLTLSWREREERIPAATPYSLEFDFCTGRVSGPQGSELPDPVAPFFREPVPSWVMDDLFEEWALNRPPIDVVGREQSLSEWKPNELLSQLFVAPNSRPEVFVREGKGYAVEFHFCVKPSCDCTANRFRVLEVQGADWTEVGSVELAQGLTPQSFLGAPQNEELVKSIYLDWRARSGDPEERFNEIRALVRERGQVVYEQWQARSAQRAAAQEAVREKARLAAQVSVPVPAQVPALAPPAETLAPLGRNSPCPCGSGKKWKRCCG